MGSEWESTLRLIQGRLVGFAQSEREDPKTAVPWWQEWGKEEARKMGLLDWLCLGLRPYRTENWLYAYQNDGGGGGYTVAFERSFQVWNDS